MEHRSELAESLLECFNDIASLLEKAHAVTLRQREALVKNDAEVITAAYKAHEEIMRRMGEIDRRAAAAATEIAQQAGLDPDADTDTIAESMGFPFADMIKREIDRISCLAARLHEEHEINHRLLQNGLDIITCCLRTIASEPKPNSYSFSAGMNESQAAVLSLDLRA